MSVSKNPSKGSAEGSTEMSKTDESNETSREKNKRKATQYQGVYERKAVRARKSDGTPIMDICYDITYKLGGKKKWEKVGWKSRGVDAKLAYLVRAEKLRGIAVGTILPETVKPSSPAFGSVAKTYLDNLKAAGKSGYAADQSRYDRHLKVFLGKKGLDQVGPRTMRDLRNRLHQSGAAAQTVKHVLALVRRIVNNAIHEKVWTGPNPVGKGLIPKVSNTRLRFLSQAESQALIQACNKRLRPIVITALSTGMRRGEILSLTWKQVDLEHGFIFLERTKSGKRREIPISSVLKETLTVLPRDPEIPWVFYNLRTKKPLQDVKGSFASALKAAEISDFHFHDLRHTFASHLVMGGTPLATVSQLLGHSDISMTMRYAHLSPSHQAAAVESLGFLFGKEEKEE